MTTETIEYGNYTLTLTVASAVNMIVALRDHHITTMDLRICFGLVECLTTKTITNLQSDFASSPPLHALQKLTGIKHLATIQHCLSHLVDQSILVVTKQGHQFSKCLIPEAQETFHRLCPGRQSLKRCLPCPRRILRMLAQNSSKSRGLTLLGLLLRAGQIGVQFCANQKLLAPLLGLAERSVNYAFDWFRQQGILSTEKPLRAWRRRRDGLFCQLHFSQKSQENLVESSPELSPAEIRQLISDALANMETDEEVPQVCEPGECDPSLQKCSDASSDFAVSLEAKGGDFAVAYIRDKKLPEREIRKSENLAQAMAEADVFDVKGKHLSNMRYVFGLYLSAVKRGLLTACSANLRNVFYAAYRAGMKGRDPAKLFSYLLRHQFQGITGADEAAVNPRLNHFREKYGSLVPELLLI